VKRHSALVAALIVTTSTAFSAHSAPRAPASVPHTPAAIRAAEVVARAEHAFNAYLGTQRVSNVWIFPTSEPNTVFVHYDADSPTSSSGGAQKRAHLLMLEMSGDQIARLTAFSPSEPL
jgi:hypothetical protein